jgi:hypothetical protein
MKVKTVFILNHLVLPASAFSGSQIRCFRPAGTHIRVERLDHSHNTEQLLEHLLQRLRMCK